jgi:hypothetical protein
LPDPLAATGDQRCRAGQAPPLAAGRRCHILRVQRQLVLLRCCDASDKNSTNSLSLFCHCSDK